MATVEVETPKKTPKKTSGRKTTKKSTNGTAQAAKKSTTETKEKNPPVYGGTGDKPDFGANARRLVQFIEGAHSKTAAKKVVDECMKRTLKKNEKAEKPDRFIRWALVVEVAQEQGLEDVTPQLKAKLARVKYNDQTPKERGLVGSAY